MVSKDIIRHTQSLEEEDKMGKEDDELKLSDDDEKPTLKMESGEEEDHLEEAADDSIIGNLAEKIFEEMPKYRRSGWVSHQLTQLNNCFP